MEKEDNSQWIIIESIEKWLYVTTTELLHYTIESWHS